MTRTSATRVRGVRNRARNIAVLAIAAVLAALGTIVSAPPIQTKAAGSTGSPGSAWAWGYNAYGQLGNGTTTNSSTAVRVTNGNSVTAVAGGDNHSLALASAGQVLDWGLNSHGQLGNATTTNSSIPVAAIVGPAIAIAGGGSHSLALTSTGQVMAWGYNVHGQLGNGTTTKTGCLCISVPVAVSLPAGTAIIAIAASANQSMALTSGGQVLAWGDNYDGELGNGSFPDSNVPVVVGIASGTFVTAIAAGGYFDLALTSTGQVLAWGYGGGGELGNGNYNSSRTPVAVSLPAGTTVTAIAAGGGFSLALTSTGQLLAWGDNTYGELGNGTTGSSTIPVPVSLPSGTTVTALAAGSLHSLALTSTGRVLAWGYNNEGELGNGTTTNASTPVASAFPGALAIAGGGNHSLAIQLPVTAVAVFPAMANNAYGGYVTAATIQNTGSAPASVSILYFDQSGASVGVDSINSLPVNASWTVRQDNGNSFPSSGGDAAQAGSAVVYSSQPVASFVNEFAPGNVGDATSYSGVQVLGGVGTTLYAPTIVNNAYGGYTTGIGLLNEGSSSTNVSITYRDGTGTLVNTQMVTGLAAHAYQALYSGDATLALPSGFAGTATMTSSSGQPLGAIVNETGPGGQFSSYDAVPSGSRLLNVPVALNNAYGGYYTGMGIQNTSATAGTVSVFYYDASGAATAKSFNIAANGSLGVYQGSSTDGPAVGAYTAVISSTLPLAAIVNEVAPAGAGSARQSTSYNAFRSDNIIFHLPLVENSGSDPWNTGEGIMNTGTSSNMILVLYYDSVTGAATGSTQKTLAPHAFWGLYQPTGGLPSGKRATAVIISIASPAPQPLTVICNESSATTFMSYDGQ